MPKRLTTSKAANPDDDTFKSAADLRAIYEKEQVAAISPEMVFTVFGREISMGKGQGLMGIVQMVKREAKKRLAS